MRILSKCGAGPPFVFFFNATATTEIYTLSLHDALPISQRRRAGTGSRQDPRRRAAARHHELQQHAAASGACCCRDRKSTRLNSSHVKISYAVFCLKKKNISI